MMPQTRTRTRQSVDLMRPIKKILLSTLVIGTFAVYALHERLSGDQAVSVALKASSGAKTQTGSTTTNSAGAGNNTAPAPASPTSPALPDGQYTGDTADAFYGNVQVAAVIQAGRLTDVRFLDYPHDRHTSQEINSQAMPWLKSVAIQAQSAQVDLISGATLTSEAFVQSLQAALDQAGR